MKTKEQNENVLVPRNRIVLRKTIYLVSFLPAILFIVGYLDFSPYDAAVYVFTELGILRGPVEMGQAAERTYMFMTVFANYLVGVSMWMCVPQVVDYLTGRIFSVEIKMTKEA